VVMPERKLCAAILKDPKLYDRAKRAKITPQDLTDEVSRRIYSAIISAHEMGGISPESVKTVLSENKEMRQADRSTYLKAIDDLYESEVDATEFTFGYLTKQKEESAFNKALVEAAEARHRGESIEKIKASLFEKIKSSESHDIIVKEYEETVSSRERDRHNRAKGQGLLRFSDRFRHLRQYFPFGIDKQTMTVIQGSTNAGKSVFLANIVWMATEPESKLNVLYIFSENREVEAMSRLDAVVLGKPYRELYESYLNEQERSQLLNRKREGYGQIVYFQPEFENFDVRQVEAALEAAKEKGINIDMIAIDSPDHMKPMKTTGTYHVDKPQVWKDLKALMQRWNILTIGTWPLREEYSGQGKGDKEPPPLTANSGAGGQDVARPMDNIIAFSYDERADDLMSHRLFVVTKCRDGQRDFQKIRYRIGEDLRFTHTDDFNAQFAPGGEDDLISAFAESED